ncbi:hypothetical protein PanWU01x14_057790 [Parasponia andersonii]|uniref:Uncharacterized protein n=1 Tax=Parasponia andersonii TaxID=3476 RepID=A0A2P5DJW8_PARAD|nr:hypothetical protein PanWU01x14_057790 [Parasponia andersonii]
MLDQRSRRPHLKAEIQLSLFDCRSSVESVSRPLRLSTIIYLLPKGALKQPPVTPKDSFKRDQNSFNPEIIKEGTRKLLIQSRRAKVTKQNPEGFSWRCLTPVLPRGKSQ